MNASIFKEYPKQRKALPKEYQDIYEEHYKNNRQGKTKASAISSTMEKWLHKCVAATALPTLKTLEIGAGTLNQLDFECSDHYDIVEPFEQLYYDSPNLHLVNSLYSDISEVPIFQKYDRIISIACFEHICDLPDMINKCCDHLSTNGILCVSIPNEGRFLWKLAYSVTTGFEFYIKYGLKYSVLMNYEHVNTADEIEKVLRYYFGSVKVKFFGISRMLALYRYYECSNILNSKIK